MTLTRQHGLTAFQLKIIALIFMTFDHIHYFLSGILPIPAWFTLIGRLAAPIFLFMVCSGFAHTHSRTRYLLRVYLFSVGMGLLNQLENRFLPHPLGAMAMGNIFATICLVVYFLLCIETLRQAKRERDGKRIFLAVGGLLLPWALQFALFSLLGYAAAGGLWQVQQIAVWAMLTILPLPLMVEGSVIFVVLGVGMYYLRRRPVGLSIFYIAASMVFLLSALPGGLTPENLFLINCQWFMVFALPFFLMYHEVRGRGMKYLFYFYYPLHMLALLLLARAIA